MKLTPRIFALDHVKYARWASVHIRDMASLKHIYSEVGGEFIKGNFQRLVAAGQGTT